MYSIVFVKLQYKEFYPVDSTKKNKKKKALGLFLECYDQNSDEFLYHIIIGDETWIAPLR